MAIVKMYDDQYDGSRMFNWLAELCGLSIDLINFLITQVSALFLASLFRSLLHPTKVSSGVRHAFGLTVGLILGYFCFGKQAMHIAGLPALCYVVIRTQNPQVVQRMVLVVALLYLSCVHMHRLYYDYGSPTIDITGALMIITQKVTTLAFSIHDGLGRDDSELTKSQRYNAIRKIPSALEYFSYIFFFQGLMAGPTVLYKDYMEFIEGYHILKHTPATNGNYDNDLSGRHIVLEPSPMKAVIKKVLGSMICAFIFIKFSAVYPIKSIKDSDFLESNNFIPKFWFVMMATTMVRFKYYHAWLMADAICNNSGLGFNGYDANGNAKWDLISNINVISFELATNFRDAINNWNMGTNLWLRTIVYERVPKKYGTVLTFSLSVLWHGFYPGYYITFASFAWMVIAARTARKLIRHRFQTTPTMRTTYDILTVLVTRIYMGYTTFPFVLLEFQASLQMYLNFYMCLHLVTAITIYGLPHILRPEKRSATSSTKNASIEPLITADNDHKIKSIDVSDINKTPIPQQTNGLANGTNKLADKSPHSTDLFANISSNLITNNGTMLSNNYVSGGSGPPPLDKDNLSFLIREKFDSETRNIENFIDKTVTGIVELKDDLMKMNNGDGSVSVATAGDDATELNATSQGLRKRTPATATMTTATTNGVNDAFNKHEIGAINAAVQQATTNIFPAVLSNGQAK